jgi:regulator of protease activity HflC (stomatin/prohibitin superfamily)
MYGPTEALGDIGAGKEVFPTIITAFGALAVAVNVVDPVGQDEFGCKTVVGGRARFHKHGKLKGLPKIVPSGAYPVFPFKGKVEKAKISTNTSTFGDIKFPALESREDDSPFKQYFQNASVNWRVITDEWEDDPNVHWAIYNAIYKAHELEVTVGEFCEAGLRTVLGGMTIGELVRKDPSVIFGQFKEEVAEPSREVGITVTRLNLKGDGLDGMIQIGGGWGDQAPNPGIGLLSGNGNGSHLAESPTS